MSDDILPTEITQSRRQLKPRGPDPMIAYRRRIAAAQQTHASTTRIVHVVAPAAPVAPVPAASTPPVDDDLAFAESLADDAMADAEQIKAMLCYPHHAQSMHRLTIQPANWREDQRALALYMALRPGIAAGGGFADRLRTALTDMADTFAAADTTELVSAAEWWMEEGRIEGMMVDPPTPEAALVTLQDWFAELFQGAENRGVYFESLADMVMAPLSAASTDPAAQWQPFPTDLLPAVMRDFATATAESACIDVSIVALPMLAVAASAIGVTRAIEYNRSFREYPILWTTPIVDSGQVKTGAFKAAMRPLQIIQRERHSAWQEAVRNWDRLYAPHRGRTAPTARPTEARPVFRPTHMNNATVEAVANVLEIESRGTFFAVDELSAWLGSFNQYKGGKGDDEQQWLTFHSAGMYTKYRVGKEPLVVDRAAVSVTGTIQPKTFRDAMNSSRESNGMLARFLVAEPPRHVGDVVVDRPVSEEIEIGWQGLIHTLLGFRFAPAGNGDPEPPQIITLNPAARTLFRDTANRDGHRGETGVIGAMLSKMRGHMLRFALIFHCIENTHEMNVVSEGTMQRAIALADWFSREAERVYRSRSTLAARDEENEIVRVARANGWRVAARQLQRAHPLKYLRGSDAAEALQEAARTGLGTIDPTTPKNQVVLVMRPRP